MKIRHFFWSVVQQNHHITADRRRSARNKAETARPSHHTVHHYPLKAACNVQAQHQLTSSGWFEGSGVHFSGCQIHISLFWKNLWWILEPLSQLTWNAQAEWSLCVCRGQGSLCVFRGVGGTFMRNWIKCLIHFEQTWANYGPRGQS